ncbi:MAG: exonuclease domain-containing protein [Anaerolineae bacterium]
MAIRKDKIIVADFEATCWEGFDAPEGQTNEIIEMGVCLLDPHTDPISISQPHSILIKPMESVVSPFCTELTTITQAMVDEQGIAFEQACTILEDEYDSRNRLWVAWGGWDKRFLLKQCRRRNVRYPFSKKHSNLKRVFHEHHGQRMHFKAALSAAHIDAQGTAHRGGDDAYNTAHLLRYLFNVYGKHILKRYGF